MKIEKNIKNQSYRLAITALMLSLVMLGTMLLRMPIPLTEGYIHLGDAMVFLSVLTLKRKDAALASGIGSALADVLGGFAMWAPWTLVIKASMAIVASSILNTGKEKGARLRYITAMASAGILLTAGYYIAELIMYGNLLAALIGIPWNIGQFAVGIVIAQSVFRPIKRFKEQEH